MRDEMDMRMWNAHHRDLSDSLTRGFERLMDAFRKLVAIQYAAPWKTARKACRS